MSLSTRHPDMTIHKSILHAWGELPYKHLLTFPLEPQQPVVGYRRTLAMTPGKGSGGVGVGGPMSQCGVELHVLCVGNSFPALLCDQQHPSSWHLLFPVVMLLRVAVGSGLCLLKSLYSLQWQQIWHHHWKRHKYTGVFSDSETSSSTTCSLPSNSFHLGLLWFLFLLYFNLLPHRSLLCFNTSPTAKVSVLLPILFLSFISCQQLHFLGLYTGGHLMSPFQNTALNFV